MPFELNNEEISDILNTLKNSGLTVSPGKKEILISSIIKWLKYKEISFETSQKIALHLGQKFGELEKKEGIENIVESIYKDDSQVDALIIEDQLIQLLEDSKGKEYALGIVRTLKSLMPQKKLEKILKIELNIL